MEAKNGERDDTSSAIGCLVIVLLLSLMPASCIVAQGYKDRLQAEAEVIRRDCEKLRSTERVSP
jgi:hypothetical protein